MADVLFATTNGLPSWLKISLKPIWHIFLRTAGFVKRAAAMLDTEKDIETLYLEVLKEFEDRIRGTGFLAGTNEPSYADIGAFAQVAFITTYGFEGPLKSSSSATVSAWYDRMKTYFPSNPTPALYPQWPPIGFETPE